MTFSQKNGKSLEEETEEDRSLSILLLLLFVEGRFSSRADS
jgi:hypothetical protein